MYISRKVQAMGKTIVVVGASRSIGAEVANHYRRAGNRVIGVSRTPSVVDEWISADISTAEGISRVVEYIGADPVDALLFMGGIWEQGAFTPQFDFYASTMRETQQVIAVNLIAPIEITKGLAKNLAQTANPRAVYIGSLSGLDNISTPEVANTASKFGLRGAIQSLRVALKAHKIGFTVINPGNVATEEVLLDIQEGRFAEQVPIPMADVISAIDWILSVSPAVEIGDINMFQR